MITDSGRLHIKRYLSAMTPDIGRSIAFGIGTTAPSATDTELSFEIARIPVDVLAYDFDQDLLIFKGEVESYFAGSITEVALFSREGVNVGVSGSRILVSFDSVTETWFEGASPATYIEEGALVGADSVQLSLAASGSKTVTHSDINIDLSEYSSADEFRVALYASNSNVSSVSVTFYTDETNYYTISNSSISSGLNIFSALKGSAQVTGAPNWSSITKVAVRANAKAAGAATVNLEGIRIEDKDTVDEEYVMVARTVFAEPFVKAPGTTQDIEFTLGVNIG